MIQFLFLLFFLIPVFLFIRTQQNTLIAIHPQNRVMQPGIVWLQLIPLFNFVWQFVVVTHVADSIKKELSSNTFSFEAVPDIQPHPKEIRPTYSFGIAYCTLYICSLLPFLRGIPLIGLLVILGFFVCWIIYWIHLTGYKKQIEQMNYALLSPPSLP
jgi:cbb3-type cytochrome oxidase subunit 3